MSLKAALKSLVDIARANPKGRRYDELGRYYPDPTPIAPPVGYVRSPTIAEQIRTMVRSEAVRQHADQQGMDTFEEADDFNIGDDYDPTSPWEENFAGEFDIPLTAQEPVARDPDDRNPLTPPAATPKAPDAPGGGFPGAPAPGAASPGQNPPAAAPAPERG